jgi:hypothetical protein
MDSSASATAEQQLTRYLRLLYPHLPPQHWLVVSWQERYFQSRWFPVAQSKQVAPFLLKTARQHDVYVGLGLRQRQTTGRGASADVRAIGGLWIEFDHASGHHTTANLPSREQLLQFLETLPFTFSMIVDSSGGFHCYLLFKELWIFESPEERDQAQALLRHFQRTVQHWAAEAGWHIDTTSDLARVLRPPGTLNHKGGTPQPVTLYQSTESRYDPSELEDAPWMLTDDALRTPPRHHPTPTPHRRSSIPSWPGVPGYTIVARMRPPSMNRPGTRRWELSAAAQVGNSTRTPGVNPTQAMTGRRPAGSWPMP